MFYDEKKIIEKLQDGPSTNIFCGQIIFFILCTSVYPTEKKMHNKREIR